MGDAHMGKDGERKRGMWLFPWLFLLFSFCFLKIN